MSQEMNQRKLIINKKYFQHLNNNVIHYMTGMVVGSLDYEYGIKEKQDTIGVREQQ